MNDHCDNNRTMRIRRRQQQEQQWVPTIVAFVVLLSYRMNPVVVDATTTTEHLRDRLKQSNQRIHNPKSLLVRRFVQEANTTTTTNCTFCTNGNIAGSVIIPNDKYVPFCELIRYNIGSTPADSSVCSASQVVTHQYCGCFTYPRSLYCNICNSQFSSPRNTISQQNQERIVPTGFFAAVQYPVSSIYQDDSILSDNGKDSKTCADILFASKQATYTIVESDPVLVASSSYIQSTTKSLSTTNISACDYTARAAWYCGCPNTVDTRQQQSSTSAEKSCYLCPRSNTSSETVALSNPTYKLPPSFQLTCQDLDDAGSLFTSDTCGYLTDDIPVDTQAYCGCSSTRNSTNITSPPPDSCSLCPNLDGSNSSFLVANADTILVKGLNGDVTCTELDTVMSFVNNSTYCSTIQAQYAYQCCVGATAPPTMQPTEAPVFPTQPPLKPTNDTISPITDDKPPTAATGSSAISVQSVPIFSLVASSCFFVFGMTI